MLQINSQYMEIAAKYIEMESFWMTGNEMYVSTRFDASI